MYQNGLRDLSCLQKIHHRWDTCGSCCGDRSSVESNRNGLCTEDKQIRDSPCNFWNLLDLLIFYQSDCNETARSSPPCSFALEQTGVCRQRQQNGPRCCVSSVDISNETADGSLDRQNALLSRAHLPCDFSKSTERQTSCCNGHKYRVSFSHGPIQHDVWDFDESIAVFGNDDKKPFFNQWFWRVCYFFKSRKSTEHFTHCFSSFYRRQPWTKGDRSKLDNTNAQKRQKILKKDDNSSFNIDDSWFFVCQKTMLNGNNQNFSGLVLFLHFRTKN
jgi:hypothetical protein